MGRPRTFDYAEARRLRATGLSYAEIARRLGVSHTAAMRACDSDFRQRQDAKSQAAIRAGRTLCVGGCGRLVWSAYREDHSGLCPTCHGLQRSQTHRPDELLCADCGEWKPDDAFPRASRNKARRGRASQCRGCSTIARQAYRERHKVPCECCGAPALPPNEKASTGTTYPRCRPCWAAGRTPEAVAA